MNNYISGYGIVRTKEIVIQNLLHIFPDTADLFNICDKIVFIIRRVHLYEVS